MPDKHYHHTHRAGWLRASVMGANDGIISTSGLLLGVAAAHASHAGIVAAGITGLVAGAIAMAAGEYISVSSQADMEEADLALEQHSLAMSDAAEHEELAAIYVERGLDPGLARGVADQLMARNALSAHARDELGISETLRARPNSGLHGIGSKLRLRGSVAAAERYGCANASLVAADRCQFLVLPRAAGRPGGTPRRRTGHGRRVPRAAMGCARACCDGRNRNANEQRLMNAK